MTETVFATEPLLREQFEAFWPNGAEATGILDELEQNRLLTEVDHLVNALDEHGYVPKDVERDIKANFRTAASEVAMPFAVSRTIHEIEYVRDPETLRLNRIFKWLGKSAVEVAESGYQFHSSAVALRRVDVEKQEAEHAQETLQKGKVQFFISPRMSKQDAPEGIAKKEHLHDDDSIRASYILKDAEGKETYRVMESLLVRDVPLPAWVALLRDPNNIFGRTITVDDEHSALSVMKTFAELELDEDQAPEGPITLVEAVIPYIEDDIAQLSVLLQLIEYRKQQQVYRQQAEETANEWYDFDLELAHSKRSGVTSPQVTSFLGNVKQLLPKAMQTALDEHQLGGGFEANRLVLAITEKVKRNIVTTKAGVKTGNESILQQVDEQTVKVIKATGNTGLDHAQREAYQQQADQLIIEQNVETSGGCVGSCGLQAVEGSKATSYIKELGGKDGDKVAEDKNSVRSCKCGAKDIVYVYNSGKVIKHCNSCKETAVEYTKRKAA